MELKEASARPYKTLDNIGQLVYNISNRVIFSFVEINFVTYRHNL